jgi:hypothetical protein
MEFTKRLREGVRRGDITCSVRIWMRPHVKVGGRLIRFHTVPPRAAAAPAAGAMIRGA